MRIICFTIILMIVQGCQPSCKEDAQFKKEFDRHMKVLIQAQQAMLSLDEEFYINEVLSSLNYLEIVTNIDAPAFDAEHGIDHLIIPFGNYISTLKNWRKENKCIMTMEKADSLLLNHSKYRDSINLIIERDHKYLKERVEQRIDSFQNLHFKGIIVDIKDPMSINVKTPQGIISLNSLEWVGDNDSILNQCLSIGDSIIKTNKQGIVLVKRLNNQKKAFGLIL